MKKHKGWLIRKTVPSIMDRAAYKVLADAKKMAPVDTGALRASGRVESPKPTERLIVFGGAGTGVDYAEFVEYGTMFQVAQPYLRPAMLKAIPHFRKATGIELDKALKVLAREGSSN